MTALRERERKTQDHQSTGSAGFIGTLTVFAGRVAYAFIYIAVDRHVSVNLVYLSAGAWHFWLALQQELLQARASPGGVAGGWPPLLAAAQYVPRAVCAKLGEDMERRGFPAQHPRMFWSNREG